MVTRRQRQVAERIKRELSLLLLLEVRDPRLATITITDVEVTPDLLLARVHFGVLGDQEAQQAAVAGLEHARGYLRSELAGRIQLRFAPDLVFHLDRSAEYGRRIDALLDHLKETGQLGNEQESA